MGAGIGCFKKLARSILAFLKKRWNFTKHTAGNVKKKTKRPRVKESGVVKWLMSRSEMIKVPA